MPYLWASNLLQLGFFFVVPILLFLILFVLYQHFYAKDQKKPRLLLIYSKIVIWGSSFLLLIFLAKMGDEMIYRWQSEQLASLHQEQNYYVDLYGCNQKFGNYDYQWGESTLSNEQIEECRTDQKERDLKYTQIDGEMRMYQILYRLSFVGLVLLTHIGIFFLANRKKD